MKDIETIEIPLDQFEAMRLCDLKQYDQTTAGENMGISRTEEISIICYMP